MSDVIDAHLAWMQVERYSKVSRAARARALYRADAVLPRGLEDVYPYEIGAYLDTPGWSDWTRHTYDAHLRIFYRWGVAAGWFDHDPMLGLPSPPCGACIPKPLSARELHLALSRSACSTLWCDCIILGVGAGLRATEMAELRREDISDEVVFVRRGKGGKPRVVPTCTTLWRRFAGRPPGPVLRRPHGSQPVTGPWLSATQRAHWCAIGLPQIHLHRLRHTFATAMYDADADPFVVADLMGHASVETTRGYALVSGRKRRHAVEALDELLLSVGGTPAGV